MASEKFVLVTGNLQDNQRFLWLPVEPTPYILALAQALTQRSPWRMQLLFMSENNSQPWNVKLDPKSNRVLPTNRLATRL